MLRFEVATGYFADFATIPLATASGDVIVADSHLIRIRTDRGFENYIGDFEYNAENLPVGTIDTYRLVTDEETPVYTIAHANIDVVELRETAASGDPQDFLKLIFRSSDRLTGAELGDRMGGFDGDDQLRGLAGDDALKGMKGSDDLRGGSGDDLIGGGKARDFLRGGAGDDRLNGGQGRNTLTGGKGDDTFVFKPLGKPGIVTDFESGDLIALGFAGLGTSGALDPDLLYTGGFPRTPDQKILYDADTGWLLYAKRGFDTVHPKKFAWVGEHLNHLDAGDFIVI